MSAVVGLDGKAVQDEDPFQRERRMAVAEMEKLLVGMKDGTYPVNRWVLYYAVDEGGAKESTSILTSGMSAERVLWMMETAKYAFCKENFGS